MQVAESEAALVKRLIDRKTEVLVRARCCLDHRLYDKGEHGVGHPGFRLQRI